MEDKQKSSLMIDRGIWKEIRKAAIDEDMEIGQYIESIFKQRNRK
jgi:predicted DNA-binding ribbon-helix-helix protein